jgi:glucose/arabinose dehydrogenase
VPVHTTTFFPNFTKNINMKHLYLLLFITCLSTASAQTIALTPFASGFSDPAEVVNAGDSRLFVVQQRGLIRIVNANGTINSTPFLNLSSIVHPSSNEGGLLGLAFHPDYANNGYFYVNYTNTAGNTVIARYSVSSNPDIASPTGTTILTVEQPSSNHNGGTMKFGPDGYLYIGMGDGGGGGDPQNRAQNKNTLLGKMLRIDVDNGSPYSNPTDNPYAGAVAGMDEIWAIGLRNPWKFSFDSETGDLWIADVGQENVEEINKQPYTEAGLNYGWRCYEGNAPYNTSGCPAASALTFPFVAYSSAGGSGNCSVTGGYVYRGSTYPNLVGKYLFADYCSNKIGIINSAGTVTYSQAYTGSYFSSFGVDSANELYVIASGPGILYKVTDSSLGLDEKPGLSFSMFPNPSEGHVNISASEAAFPIKMSVFDITGKHVLTTTVSANNTTVDTSVLSSGVYLVSIEDQSGAKAHGKLAAK